jgi:hypothetical protein
MRNVRRCIAGEEDAMRREPVDREEAVELRTAEALMSIGRIAGAAADVSSPAEVRARVGVETRPDQWLSRVNQSRLQHRPARVHLEAHQQRLAKDGGETGHDRRR